MKALSTSDFLDLWERGSHLHPLDQALLILRAVLPDTSSESLADWPFGRRNRALAEVRCHCFGPSLPCWTSCTRCGEQLEFEVDGRTLAAEAVDVESSPSEPIIVRGHAFRLPTSRDLALAAREMDSRLAAIRIMERCRVDATDRAGWSDDGTGWSDDDIEEVGQHLALADPMAEIVMTLRCPVCDNHWTPALDLATFLWAEIEARATRALHDVHALASAYGWTEREILSLGEQRRSFYLAMVRE